MTLGCSLPIQKLKPLVSWTERRQRNEKSEKGGIEEEKLEEVNRGEQLEAIGPEVYNLALNAAYEDVAHEAFLNENEQLQDLRAQTCDLLVIVAQVRRNCQAQVAVELPICVGLCSQERVEAVVVSKGSEEDKKGSLYRI